MDDFTLTDNTDLHQYEMLIDGAIARIKYKKNGMNEVILTHTEIPESLQGQGLGSILAHKVLTYIKQQGLRVIPQCPFMIAYIKRHSEWNEIIA